MELPENAEFVGYADDVALVVVAQDPIELQDVTNECLELGVTWMAGRSLVLAVPKCEAVVRTRRRGFRKCKQPVLLINGEEVPQTRAVKYLGVWLDDEWTFKRYLSEASQEADRTGTALQRLMPNIGGPKPSRRELLNNVSSSVMLHGSLLWGQFARGAEIDKRMAPVQRRAAMRTISSYRTLSRDATCVLAKTPPIRLLVDERLRIWRAAEHLKTVVSQVTHIK